MKILLIVESHHRQNTLKVAEAIAEAAPVTIAELKDIASYNPEQYDIIGFGSGIYAGKFDKKLIKYAEKDFNVKKPCFVISTSGTGKYEKYNAAFIKLLTDKGCEVLGSFGCKGFCKWFIFAIVGGIAKGKPDIEDFSAAQSFIEDVMRKAENAKTAD